MSAVFEPVSFPDHALLDSGGSEKLERFGDVVVRRPDPQALWRKRLSEDEWSRRAELVFVRESDRGGRWEGPARRRVEDRWWVGYDRARFRLKPTSFKHVGLFPEQAANWRWVEELREELGEAPELLSLFAYTGAGSIAAALAGYRVTHVDASKSAIGWTRENAEASGLAERGMRIVLDDALAFARREVRRGRKYAGVLLDPPHYGRGPKGEKWQLEEGLAPLLDACAELLEERSFLVLSTYAVGYSPLAFENMLGDLPGGEVRTGELVLKEEGEADRLLPCGFCARWRRGSSAPA